MFARTTAIQLLSPYDQVSQRLELFEQNYHKIYPLYQSLGREDFRLSQLFWHELMTKVHELEQFLLSIEQDIAKLDISLQQSVADRKNDAQQKANGMKSACLQHLHIQKNWVRIRIWDSGYFDKEDKFVPQHIVPNLRYHIKDRPRTNIGHASLETPSGYMSFWPGAKNEDRSFNSLRMDLCDEGPDAEKKLLYLQKRPRDPDHIITFFSLDTTKIDDFCRNYVRSETIYDLKGKTVSKKKKTEANSTPVDNCITACIKVLAAGGIENLWTEKDFVYNIIGTPTPAYFAAYLKKVQKEEEIKYALVKQLQAPIIPNPPIFIPGTIQMIIGKSFLTSVNGQELRLNVGDIVTFVETGVGGNRLRCDIPGKATGFLVPVDHIESIVDTVATAQSNNNNNANNNATPNLIPTFST